MSKQYPSLDALESLPNHSHTQITRSDARFSVSTLSASSSRVRLEGYFKPAWMVGLCGGLSDRRVSIERAHATRTAEGGWHAELDVSPPSELDLESLPYIELTDSERSTDEGTLVLESFQLTGSPDHGGTLKLTFDAPDSLGLLGRVLGILAMMGLFPIELQIETRAGYAHDTLWLSGLGRAAPSPLAHQNLERMLTSKLKRGRAST